ncbi:asparaginase [Martelella mediterranea]|uniref:Putative L-asparaginase n=1 Tax=Martelella mediterranea DSM 17316 TaxID=1122214 RepID=A0A1U9Z5I8_9HYPH|nr:asparaginase [Martelella mediterranea]AQZ52983.1 putative L-asparaginase [Martelella mediterranea DSM 17316]
MVETARNTKAKVTLIVLGGTITMTADASGGITPKLSAQALVDAVPGLAEIADVEPLSPFKLPSASLTLEQLGEVARMARRAVDGGASGVVVVQGTDTIEETAFALDCMWAEDAPIIVTGAMRGPEAAGADGPANILASVIAASSDQARSRGALVVMNDCIHTARAVTKSHTGLCSAFTSGAVGPAGEIMEGRPFFFAPPSPRRLPAIAPPSEPVPPVALLKLGLGEDARLVEALPGLGYKGAVIEAMGAGHVAERLSEPLGALAATMPVALASRTGNGPVFKSTYGYKGGEIDLLSKGLINAGRLSGLKARLLLQLLLASGGDREDCASALKAAWDR